MEFTLTHEQRLLQDSASRFARERYHFESWRKLTQAKLAYSPENWRQMAELGWLALTIPEGDGGLGGAPGDVALLMEQFGRVMVLEPYVSTCVIGALLAGYAQQSRKQQLIDDIASGDCRIALAVGEADNCFDLRYVETKAVRQGEGFAISGYKSHVPDGSSADCFIIPARTSGQTCDQEGITLFLVKPDAEGIVRRNYRAPDHRHVSAVHLANVVVDETTILGEVGKGFELLDMAVDHAIVATLAEALGTMTAASDMTLEYLKTRQQFGTTIGSFQSLQHRMVDMTIACEEARSMVYFAIENLRGSTDARRRAVSAAKVRVSQSALFVGQQAVQLHGGIGASDELAISHFLKRLMMFELSFGNIDYHRGRFAETTLGQ